jgi:hypothetical protein
LGGGTIFPRSPSPIYNIPDPSGNNIRNTNQQKVTTPHWPILPHHSHPRLPGNLKKRWQRIWRILEQTRVQFPAGLDNRCENLHGARFVGGAVCLLQKYWLDARERLGLASVTPFSGYNFETVGIAGSITSKGLWDMHNPAIPHLKLKYFSSSNVGSAFLSSRRNTLAENDQPSQSIWPTSSPPSE